MSDQLMISLGKTNAGWGVCGFTSTFYAMYDLNHDLKGKLVNATAEYRVLAEIKTYLMMLKAAGETGLLNGITAFTRKFGGRFSNFTIDGYIQHINGAAGSNLSANTIKKDSLFGIAMPPSAVADYAKRVWGWDATVHEFPNCSSSGDGIIGVRVRGTGGGLFGTGFLKPKEIGLVHYMYRGNGAIYSWGKKFGSVQEAADYGAGGARWEVCYYISFNRN